MPEEPYYLSSDPVPMLGYCQDKIKEQKAYIEELEEALAMQNKVLEGISIGANKLHFAALDVDLYAKSIYTTLHGSETVT